MSRGFFTACLFCQSVTWHSPLTPLLSPCCRSCGRDSTEGHIFEFQAIQALSSARPRFAGAAAAIAAEWESFPYDPDRTRSPASNTGLMVHFEPIRADL